MSNVRSVVEYGAMGVGMTIFLYCIFGFAPSLVTAMSLADVFGSFEGESGWILFFPLFGALIAVQMALQANIRHTWAIVIVWWVLSIWPFFHWFHWFYMNTGSSFPGVDWMPW